MRKTIRIILAMIVLFGCKRTEWLDYPPEDFIGKFIQVSDRIIQGYEKPIEIDISDGKFQYNSLEDGVKRTYPILKVSKTGNQIVIFCGVKNKDHIAHHRFKLFWGADHYLYLSDIFETGYNNEDVVSEIGKFIRKTQ